MRYKQISTGERKEIESFLNNRDYSLREIGKIMKRNVSTISREIRRNRNFFTREYTLKTAKQKAYVRKKYCKYQSMKIIGDMKLRQYIETHLRQNWSPEEISGRIGEELCLQRVGKTSIYKFIRSVYGRQLEQEIGYHLIHRKKKYGDKKKGSVMKLEDRIFIDQRPEKINARENYGDWEGDFIVSGKDGKGALLVLYERKSRFSFIRKLEGRSIYEVHRNLIRVFRHIKSLNSLTLDNDIAFRHHERLSEELKTKIYFCHPYHSREKGGVEYTNRLIREYIPKGYDISKISEDDILKIEVQLNNRPRKVIGFKTPLEMMIENNQFSSEFQNYPREIW